MSIQVCKFLVDDQFWYQLRNKSFTDTARTIPGALKHASGILKYANVRAEVVADIVSFELPASIWWNRQSHAPIALDESEQEEVRRFVTRQCRLLSCEPVTFYM